MKQVMLKTMLVAAFGFGLVGTSSCDDDSDSGNGNPDITENSAEASTTGDVKLDLNADVGPKVKPGPGSLTIQWFADSATVFVTVPDDSTGTFDVGKSGDVTVTAGEFGGLGTSGTIEIITNNKDKVVGTLNDIKLLEQGQSDDRTATLNGKFNASKPSGSNDTVLNNIAVLSGAAKDTIKAVERPTYDTVDQTVSAAKVEWSDSDGNKVMLKVKPPDAVGQLAVAKLGSPDAPEQYASLSLTYNASGWALTGDGTIKVLKNSERTFAGSFNDVVLKDIKDDDKVTVNGSFSVPK